MIEQVGLNVIGVGAALPPRYIRYIRSPAHTGRAIAWPKHNTNHRKSYSGCWENQGRILPSPDRNMCRATPPTTCSLSGPAVIRQNRQIDTVPTLKIVDLLNTQLTLITCTVFRRLSVSFGCLCRNFWVKHSWLHLMQLIDGSLIVLRIAFN